MIVSSVEISRLSQKKLYKTFFKYSFNLAFINQRRNQLILLYYFFASFILIAPFERMGDFVGERMDILEDKVKASIRKYNRRRYYNDVRRVDYDLNYEYIDDDYYYYDK